jgi:hypothetical protein
MAVMAPETDRPDPSDRPDRPGVASDYAQAEAAAAVLARIVASLESERYSGEDSVRWVRLFTRVERCGVAGKTLAARRVGESNLHRRSGHRSAAEYLAAETGDSVGETKDLIRLGEQLGDQPELAGAFCEGSVSRRRAAQVSDAVAVNPGKEAELVAGAKADTDAQLRERCQRAKAQGRTADEEARHYRRLHQNRRCFTGTDTDGAFVLRALLAPDAGARVRAALEAQAERVFEQARTAGAHEGGDAYRADALVALVTGRGVLGPRGEEAGPTPDPRAQLFIRADLTALRRGHVAGDELCEIPGVGPVSVETAVAHLGEALTRLVVTDGVDVTTVYSPGRHIPRSVRAALLERDSRCVVPGCDARLGLENDHWVTDFAQGGPTALANLARLCHRHHQQRTHQGFQLLGGPGHWQWITPEPPVVPTRSRPRRRARGPAPPAPAADPPRFRREE